MEIFGEGQFPVSVDYLVALQEYAAERGVPPQQILEHTGVPVSVLVKRDARIGHLAMDRAVHNVQKALNDPFLAIAYGKRLTISKHGGLGYAAQSASTLWEAARLIEQYIRIRSGGGEEFELVERDDHACFRIYPLDGSTHSQVAQFHIMSTLFSIETIGRWIANVAQDASVKTEMLFAFDFPHEIPERFLSPGLHVRFNEPVNELRFSRAFMDRPLPQASADLSAIAREACELELERLNALHTIAGVVRHIIRDNLGKPMTLESVAESLNMSARTLKRRLHDAGTSFQHIKDAERFRRAMTRLESSADSLEVLAEELGYSDASNFAKAFRNWSGVSPGEYRERVLKSQTGAPHG